MKPLLIIVTGHTPAPIRARLHTYAHWFRTAMRLSPASTKVVDATEEQDMPSMASIRGAVLTGSGAMVTDHHPWSEKLAVWIQTAIQADLPLLGVCYGHQLMAYASGCQVGDLPGGREMGTPAITLSPDAGNDPLLAGLPATFDAQVSHQQSVLEVPDNVQVLGYSRRDPHHILRYGSQALSVQFHPEFSVATSRAFIRLRQTALTGEGVDIPVLLESVHAAPYARQFLRRFERHTRRLPLSNDRTAA